MDFLADPLVVVTVILLLCAALYPFDIEAYGRRSQMSTQLSWVSWAAALRCPATSIPMRLPKAPRQDRHSTRLPGRL